MAPHPPGLAALCCAGRFAGRGARLGELNGWDLFLSQISRCWHVGNGRMLKYVVFANLTCWRYLFPYVFLYISYSPVPTFAGKQPTLGVITAQFRRKSTRAAKSLGTYWFPRSFRAEPGIDWRVGMDQMTAGDLYDVLDSIGWMLFCCKSSCVLGISEGFGGFLGGFKGRWFRWIGIAFTNVTRDCCATKGISRWIALW